MKAHVFSTIFLATLMETLSLIIMWTIDIQHALRVPHTQRIAVLLTVLHVLCRNNSHTPAIEAEVIIAQLPASTDVQVRVRGS